MRYLYIKYYNMKQVSKVLLIAVFLAANGISGWSQNADSVNIVTTAVPFLRISPDARAGGMGDVGISMEGDVNSVFWNHAKIPFNKRNGGFGLTYTPWLRDLGLNDVYMITAAGYNKINDNAAISGGIRYFSLGSITLTDFFGNTLNTVRPAEFSLEGAYSLKLNDRMGIGIGLKYINSRLVVGDVGGVVYKAGNAVAGDISYFYDGTFENGSGTRFGVTLSNLGSKIGYTNDARNKDYIPANLGFGVSYTSMMDEFNKVTFCLDVNKVLVPAPPVATGVFSVDSAKLDQYRNQGIVSSWFKSFGEGSGGVRAFQFSVGAEYAYNDQFFARAGYFYEDKTKGNRRFFSAGAGFKQGGIGINISYIVPSGSGITRNPLSNTLRLGLIFDFGDAEAPLSGKSR